MAPKTTQLQIRVSPAQKRALQRQARAANLSVSEWVLCRALPSRRDDFEKIVRALEVEAKRTSALAALHDLLGELPANELDEVVGAAPAVRPRAPYDALVAAMIEHAADQKRVPVPNWVLQTPATPTPYFATELVSLRLHLLLSSPPAFRRRNCFVDSTIGSRL